MKQVAKLNGLEPPTNAEQDPAVLAMKIQSLEGSMEKLVKAMQQNGNQLVRAFEMTDMHIHVLERVCNDTARGTVRWAPIHPEDKKFLDSNPPYEQEQCRGWLRVLNENSYVNLAWYQWQYYQMKQFEGFIVLMRRLGAWLPPKPASATVEEENEDTEYFGGDG